ncbi:hypothetical protein FGB62_61g180 [Gracilaria domingensis]|nr:hypothetical protein FGB62_61g180 [Gracilaria domingensis]
MGGGELTETDVAGHVWGKRGRHIHERDRGALLRHDDAGRTAPRRGANARTKRGANASKGRNKRRNKSHCTRVKSYRRREDVRQKFSDEDWGEDSQARCGEKPVAARLAAWGSRVSRVAWRWCCAPAAQAQPLSALVRQKSARVSPKDLRQTPPRRALSASARPPRWSRVLGVGVERFSPDGHLQQPSVALPSYSGWGVESRAQSHRGDAFMKPMRLSKLRESKSAK